ncbi:hypothetical protein LCGC14_3028130, partial [marine sediment metagenome]
MSGYPGKSPATDARVSDDGVVWQDLESGGYTADLSVWERLADDAIPDDEHRARVLELGAGTGRVTLALAERGHRVTAIDNDPQLIDALGWRAGERGLPVSRAVADLRSFELGSRFDLAIAPMQVLQLLAGAAERHEALRHIARHLGAGGRAAVALLADGSDLPVHPQIRPLPDATEREGWAYSSRPVAVESLDGGAAIALRRIRRAVSPSGEIAESSSYVRLEVVSPGQL